MSATEGQREDHEDEIISMVRMSLVDDEANVRVAAARAFDILQQQMGAKAIDQTIPTLLEALRQPGKGSGTALEALKEVMSVSVRISMILVATLTSNHAGASLNGIPRVDTNPDCYAHVRLQCTCIGIPRHRCGKCLEQTLKCYYVCVSQSLGRN